jgi:hypothetical protein
MSDNEEPDDSSFIEVVDAPLDDASEVVEEVTIWAPEPGPDSDDIVSSTQRIS